MAIRPEFRWWLLTLGIVAILLAISFLALDRPDVSWAAATPLCPHCHTRVPLGSTRCPTCRELYDWVVAPDDESPLSRWSLSALEADWVRDRVQALGDAEAARRVGVALALLPEGAARYLSSLGRGRCGWCGGTGEDLTGETKASRTAPCPVCFGRGFCIACDGDRRIRVGDLGADRAWRAYVAALLDVAATLPLEAQRQEVRRLNEAFVARYAGCREATWLVFWPAWEVGQIPGAADSAVVNDWVSAVTLPRAADRERAVLSEAQPAVKAARERLDAVLLALGSN